MKRFALLFAFFVFLAGCNSGRSSVEGAVTFDGSPVDGGTIISRPEDAGSGAPRGGEIKDGKYLVESVKGYAAHEQTTFEDVTRARTASQQAQGVAEQAQAENALTAAIGRLFAVAEAYPQLRASENFQQLQAQLGDTEQKIAVSRQVYNDTVLTYDNALESVPTNVVAGMFGFEKRSYFEIEDPAAREAPKVQF